MKEEEKEDERPSPQINKDDRCIGWQGGKVTAMATLPDINAEAFDAPCFVKTPPTPPPF